jgi:capsular exopolysaccharide synthesis family protein
VGFQWAPTNIGAGREIRFTIRVPRDAAVRLSQSLQTFLPQDGSVLRLQLQGTDAGGIASTVNDVADRFVEVATLLKRENLTSRREVLKDQMASALVDLNNSESALESFRVQTITELNDGGSAPIAPGLAATRDPVRAAFFRLRLDRDSLAMERDAIRRALGSNGEANASLLVALGTIPSVRNATELSAALTSLGAKRAKVRELRLVFASSHPDVVALDAEIQQLETRTIPEQARILADNLDRRVADFDGRIASSGREMQMIPVRATNEARLERQVDIARTIYTQLQAAYEEARLAELSAAPDVRVLDRAVTPTQPITDRLLLIIAGGFFGGLGLGIVLALLLDRFDRRIRYPEQVTKELGLTILGALPMVENNKSGKPNPEQASHLLEALRSVRMNLGYAHGAAGTLITTITSPGAGDGKSFVSANLAKAFSSSGRRTLLIDADTRRGLQHRTMGVDRKPGLLDYLSGNATREQIIRPIPAWGIDFIPCGTRMAGGPELLSSPLMAQLILGLRAEYQVMIIDSPPIGAGVDPLVLASLCGSLVMVLRTGVTDRELAESRLHELHRLPIRVLGAVLNDVKPEGIYRYYSYIPGYRSEDEAIEDEPTGKPKRRLLGLR